MEISNPVYKKVQSLFNAIFVIIIIVIVVTWNFAMSVFGGIWLRPETTEAELIELMSELLRIPSDDPPLQTESRLETADEQDSLSKPKFENRAEMPRPCFLGCCCCCCASLVGRLFGGRISVNRFGGFASTFALLLFVGIGSFVSAFAGICKWGFGSRPGRFFGVLSAELEHEPDPNVPVSFSSWSRPTTDIGRRYLGGEMGDASWSESTKRRRSASDDDVTLDESSVSSHLQIISWKIELNVCTRLVIRQRTISGFKL